jgi:hypothetical protein
MTKGTNNVKKGKPQSNYSKYEKGEASNQIRMVKVVILVVTILTTRMIVLSGLLIKVKIILLLLMNPFMLTFH